MNRGTCEEGEYYECGLCGARTTDPCDVRAGYCAPCGHDEYEVANWLGEVLAAQAEVEFSERTTLVRERPAA